MMIGRRSIIGLSLLCALLLSAIGVANASAAGTTAFTCKPKSPTGGVGFSDEHCTNEVFEGATFEHASIGENVATKFAGTNNVTGSETSLAILKGTLAGVAVELSATGVKTEGTITNKTVSKVMQNVGEGITVTYTGVKVTKPAGLGCTVPGETLTTKSLKSTTIEGTGATATGVKLEPTTGTTFIEIPIEGCAVKGTFPVTGSAVGTPAGATLKFTPESTTGLKFGGNTASLENTLTIRMAPNGSEPTNPIVYTTTEP
ncbi:MAG TPA: hypothetical protein VHB53_12295 [Solirubrobacterales bacterium]|nr:hypothetical protein [Solirubrobacterales bacterium]